MTIYALDGTGQASANLIVGESSSIGTIGQLSDSYFYPAGGLFYQGGFTITYTPTAGQARALVKGTDYDFAFAIRGVVPNNNIYAALRVMNKALQGTLTLTYQALGGLWTIDQAAINQYISTHALDPKVAYMGLTTETPIIPQGATAPLVLSSLAALELAQLIQPSGVTLTVVIMELSQAEIYMNQPSPGSNNSGGSDVSNTNYSLEQGGNLDAIRIATSATAQNTQALGTAAANMGTAASNMGTAASGLQGAAADLVASAAATGSVSDVAYSGSGQGSVVALLKGAFAKLASLVTQLPASLGAKAAANSLSVTMAIDQPAVPVTSSGGSLALDSSIQALINAVKGTVSIEGSLWVDVTVNPPVYYVRRETYNQTAGTYTITWQTPGGVSANPTVGNLSAVGQGETMATEQTSYLASSSGTGYAANDLLIHTFGIDVSTSPPTMGYQFWLNATSGAILTSSPANGTYALISGGGGGGGGSVTVTSSALPSNAAQETGGNLAAVAAAQGAPSDIAWGGAGNSSVIGLLKGLFAKLSGTLTATITGALPAGSAAIGTVGVTALPALPTGSNTIGNVGVTSLPSLPAGAANIGSVNIASLPALPAGANSIGTVSVSSLPQLPTGTNTIGTVNVGTLPSLPTGSNTIGTVNIGGTLPPLSAGSAAIGTVAVTALPALPAGANAIGSVSVSALPALPTGTNTIGAVTGAAGAALALDSSVQTLINTIKATVNITGTVWFDPTTSPPTYYVRRESVNEGTGVITVSWLTPSGSAATPTVANLQAVGDADSLQSENLNYTATAGGTGYVSGDILIHAYAIDRRTSPPSVAYNFWFNGTQAAVLAGAPTNGTYTSAQSSSVTVTSTVLATNAAQETGGNLAAIAGAQGTTADAAYGGSGSGSVVALLKGIYAKLAGTLTVTASGTVTANIGTAGTLAVESGGNLAAINTSAGAVGDAAWTGTGNGTRTSILKAIWGRLTGVQYVIASDGTYVPVDSLAQTLTYDGNGVLQTVAVSYAGHTYTQTLTYTSGNLTGQSVWVMS